MKSLRRGKWLGLWAVALLLALIMGCAEDPCPSDDPKELLTAGRIILQEYGGLGAFIGIDRPPRGPQAMPPEPKTERPDLEAAIACLHKAVSLDPTIEDGYYHLAVAHTLNGDIREATEYFSEAIARGQQLEISPAILQGLLLHQQLYDEAEKVVDAYAAGGADKGNVLALRMRSSSARGDYKSLLEQSREVMELSPENSGVYVMLGQAWLGLGEPDKAEVAFAKALELNPELGPVIDNVRGMTFPE